MLDTIYFDYNEKKIQKVASDYFYKNLSHLNYKLSTKLTQTCLIFSKTAFLQKKKKNRFL